MIQNPWRHKNLKESFLGALKGLAVVLKSERNARIIFLVGLIVLITAIFLQFPFNELVILIIVVISVFVCEVFNTLVENICNMIKPENDPHVKILKDIASAAVFIACIGALAIGMILFLPKLLSL
ncbi:MAG: diacylglycerol kinase family protein [Candidatus Omnitrophota bacterium]|nr:MAG: diacylglycerol kinase family protein [Candidatus Omnitrophota bacterium]